MSASRLSAASHHPQVMVAHAFHVDSSDARQAMEEVVVARVVALVSCWQRVDAGFVVQRWSAARLRLILSLLYAAVFL